MKQTLINKITMCLLLSGMNNFAWSMESRSMGNRYTVGEWDNDSVSSHGISMMASSNGNSTFKEISLVDLKDLRKCFFKGWLEITSDNHECLLQYSEVHETAFNNYNRGIFIKQWKASLGTDKLLDLLFKFTHITKFKFDVIWDQDDVDMAETISRSVQFFPSLTELTIAKCRLTDGGMTDVMESIESPASLRILDIRDNTLSEGILLQIREFFTNLTDFKSDLIKEKSKAVSPVVTDSITTPVDELVEQIDMIQLKEISQASYEENESKRITYRLMIKRSMKSLLAEVERYQHTIETYKDSLRTEYKPVRFSVPLLLQPDQWKDRVLLAEHEIETLHEIYGALDTNEKYYKFQEARTKPARDGNPDIRHKLTMQQQKDNIAKLIELIEKVINSYVQVVVDKEIPTLSEIAETMAQHIIERPIGQNVPDIAREYDAIYQRFIGGKLIYKPDLNSDAGKIEIPFTSLSNPLEGTFDLSRCGDAGQYLCISTGYRKRKIAAHANKLEVWIVPKFTVESDLNTSASHYREIMAGWTSDVALFWSWGSWENEYYDYLTSRQIDEISSKNLYENCIYDAVRTNHGCGGHTAVMECFNFSFKREKQTVSKSSAPTEEWLASERIKRRPEFDNILLKTGISFMPHGSPDIQDKLISIYENQTMYRRPFINERSRNQNKNVIPNVETEELILSPKNFRMHQPRGPIMLWALPLALKMNSKIKHLHLSDFDLNSNHFSQVGYSDVCKESLTDAVTCNQTIQRLTLSNIRDANDLVSDFLVPLIHKNKSVHTIRVSSTDALGVRRQWEKGPNGQNIIPIPVPQAALQGALSASLLANALQTDQMILHLDISSNGIGDAGAVSFAQMLSINQTLKELDLSYNWVGDVGITALAQGLHKNKTLKILKITGMPEQHVMTNKGIEAIAQMLLVNGTIHTIHLNGNKGCTPVLFESLLMNRTVHTIYFPIMGGDITLKMIADVLKVNPILRSMGITNNQFTPADIAYFIEVLKENNTLQEILFEGNFGHKPDYINEINAILAARK